MNRLRWMLLGIMLGSVRTARLAEPPARNAAFVPAPVDLDPENLDPDEIEKARREVRGAFWGVVLSSIFVAVMMTAAIGAVAGIFGRGAASRGVTVDDAVSALRVWFGLDAMPAICLGAVTAGVAMTSGINIAIANAMARPESFITVRAAVEAESWYWWMRRASFLAGASSLTLSTLAAGGFGDRAVGTVGLMYAFSLGSVLLSAAVRGRAKTAVDSVRANAFDQRTLNQVSRRQAELDRALSSMPQRGGGTRRAFWAVVRGLAAVAAVETLFTLVATIPFRDHPSWWRPAVGAGLISILYLLINGAAAAFAVARWSDATKHRRWHGVSWVSPILRLGIVLLAIELAREAIVYPTERSAWGIVVLLLAGVPTWWAIWRAGPGRLHGSDWLARWLGRPIWGLVEASLAAQSKRVRQRIANNQTDSSVLIGALR